MTSGKFKSIAKNQPIAEGVTAHICGQLNKLQRTVTFSEIDQKSIDTLNYLGFDVSKTGNKLKVRVG